ncbi:hypothetical protein QL285_094426 [Trifolium repens]|nr:hypothetical protein QL285_094426 [Trifolium repens]
MSPQLNEYAETACSPTSLIPNATYIKQSQSPVGDYTPHSLDTCQTIPSTSLGLLLSKSPIPQNRFITRSNYFRKDTSTNLACLKQNVYSHRPPSSAHILFYSKGLVTLTILNHPDIITLAEIPTFKNKS